MIRVLWAISPIIRDLLARCMPANRLLNRIRTRQGLKWGVPAMGIGVLFFLIAFTLTRTIDDGGPGWFHILVLWAVWNGFKFTWIGPITLIKLVLCRHRETQTRRRLVTGTPAER
jgi:hypothetical protein